MLGITLLIIETLANYSETILNCIDDQIFSKGWFKKFKKT